MAQAGVALNDSDTVRSGEVWLFGAANAVWPVVVVGAYRTFKNGLRPSVDQDQPLLLKATEALQLHVFSKSSSATSDGIGTIFCSTGMLHVREPRQLLRKLAVPLEVKVERCRSEKVLFMTSVGVAEMQKLMPALAVLGTGLRGGFGYGFASRSARAPSVQPQQAASALPASSPAAASSSSAAAVAEGVPASATEAEGSLVAAAVAAAAATAAAEAEGSPVVGAGATSDEPAFTDLSRSPERVDQRGTVRPRSSPSASEEQSPGPDRHKLRLDVSERQLSRQRSLHSEMALHAEHGAARSDAAGNLAQIIY